MKRIFCFFLALWVAAAALAPVAAAPGAEEDDKKPTAELAPEAAAAAQKHPGLFEFFNENYGIQLTDESDIALYAMVKRWLRTPYRYGGLSKNGVDCQGFVRVVHDELYCRQLSAGAGWQFRQTTPVKKEDLREGDLVFFKIAQNRISHVGVYLADGKFVHASVCCGVIVSDLSQAYYKRWWYSGGRLKPGAGKEI